MCVYICEMRIRARNEREWEFEYQVAKIKIISFDIVFGNESSGDLEEWMVVF